jgi:hypothetical protein
MQASPAPGLFRRAFPSTREYEMGALRPPFIRAAARALLRAGYGFVLLAISLHVPAARAQAGAGSLRVTVTDGETHQPLPRARVQLLDGRALVADDGGILVITGLEEGTTVLEVNHIGHTGRRVLGHVRLDAVAELAVELRPEPIQVEGVAAMGGAFSRNRMVRDFYRRAESGGGRYFTRAEIERINPRRVSDLFRMVPGMTLVSTSTGERPEMEGGQVGGQRRATSVSRLGGGGSERGAGECPTLYFLDGTPIEPAGGVISNEVDVREVEGIEVYRSVAMAPPQYRRTGNYCGVILIWKREKID